MKLPYAVIAFGILLFLLKGPDVKQIHTLAWTLAVVDALFVAYTLFFAGGES